MFNVRLLENIQIVPLFVPGADINTDKTGDWVSLKNYDRCTILFHKEAGTAGDDPVISILQATDVSGTSSKALNIDTVYAKVGATALTGVGTFTKYTGTAAATVDLVSCFGTDLAADTGEALIAVDIAASQLDVTNGFDCLTLFIEGDDIGNATKSCAYAILYNASYPGPTALSAIID
jgi:hypothetical protein